MGCSPDPCMGPECSEGSELFTTPEQTDPPLPNAGTACLDFKQSIFPSSAIKLRSHRGVENRRVQLAPASLSCWEEPTSTAHR